MINTSNKEEITGLALEILIKAVLVGMLLFYAFEVIKPFLVLILWGIIIAVALSPLITKLDKKLKLSRTWIVSIFTVLMVTALLVPTYMLSDSVIHSSTELAHDLKNGTVVIPAPTENVKEWPLIGEKTYSLWSEAATNLKSTLKHAEPVLKEYGAKVASIVTGTLGSILQFVASLIIAAIFLAKSESGIKSYHTISRRLAGERGVEWAELSALTIRSVVQGVIGIALIQAVLSFAGMLAMDVPFAWVWAFVILFVAIIQIPVNLITIPIIIYVFSYAEGTSATIFAVYMFIVAISDGFLKPMFLGRGIDIPMLVILLGAIGGMILSGILGLFIGAVGLALAYKLFMVWLEEDMEPVKA
ncbi:AI-2E family transporter [Sulfurimonas paralvinellae]|uniref:AI-2E family transporter n=1 Tax=Sulfurimonas paralvinellae TaxID=317658 RepID=A0A7M1B7C5_9BACT|nr:AI-2E family transporter [Sulfurimonas paralvinellae]QOP45627.1 AI-2E family transporter [Sulfurimonas paralvinellae]